MPKHVRTLAILAVLGVFGLIGACASFERVEVGHEAAGTLFGEPVNTTLDSGLHVVNPLIDWTHYDLREKSITFEGVEVPAEDQQKATMDISVQFRLRTGMTNTMLSETGGPKEVINVHFIPRARSVLREAGKGVEKVELFFEDEAQQRYQDWARADLSEQLLPFGVEVKDVLIRDVELPPVIKRAIEAKKQREQQVEQERAELERKRLEFEQQVAQAEADRKAAEQEAEKIRTLAQADAERVRVTKAAEAEGIRQVNVALTPTYVDYLKAQKWNGALPRFMVGEQGAGMFLNIDPERE